MYQEANYQWPVGLYKGGKEDRSWMVRMSWPPPCCQQQPSGKRGTAINYTCQTGARASRQILPANVASDQEAQGNNLLGQTVFTAKRMETDSLNKSKWLYCPQVPWCCAASPLSPLPLQYLTKLTCPKHPSPQSCSSYLMTSTPLPPAW